MTIVDGAITADNLSAEEIITDSAQITAAIINDAHIANLSVTGAKIANSAIGTAKIADAAITNAKIGDLAVDTLKIADRAVTVPNFSYTAGTVNVTSDTTETTLASITFTRDAGFSTRLGVALPLLSGATSGSGAHELSRLSRQHADPHVRLDGRFQYRNHRRGDSLLFRGYEHGRRRHHLFHQGGQDHCRPPDMRRQPAIHGSHPVQEMSQNDADICHL